MSRQRQGEEMKLAQLLTKPQCGKGLETESKSKGAKGLAY